MARIAVLVSNPCLGDARVIKMARAAAAAGHEVHVFATQGSTGAPLFEVDARGITYHRLDWRPGQILTAKPPFSWLMRLHRKTCLGLVKRVVPYLKYHMYSRVYAESVARVRPDIIHAHDLICLKAAHDAAAECGASVVYDAHELELHRNPPLPFLQKRLVSRTERKYARASAAVNTVGELVKGVLAKHIRRDDINVLYNSPIIEECPRGIRQDLALGPEAPLLIYVGKVTTGRGVGEILTVLAKANEVFFATVGPCDETTRRTLYRQAEANGVANRFRILPAVPFEQVVDYIRGADLGVISVEPVTLSYLYCMPNKLFELSFADVPIISNRLEEIEGYLAELGNGEIVELENKAVLPYAITRMIKQKRDYLLGPDKRAQLERKYSWAAQADKLLAVYAKILAGRSAS